jgi:uncharacterized protein with GYD domain
LTDRKPNLFDFYSVFALAPTRNVGFSLGGAIHRTLSRAGEKTMQFSLRAQYTAKSMQALIQNPTDRTQAISTAIQAVGGKLTSFFGTGGGTQQGVLIIYEVPDGICQTALINALVASNAVRKINAQRLFTGAETVEALTKAQGVEKAYETPAVRRS